jgi:EAL domain-containing protein (putative c-di-GMP-specific phosphodiesterase class I)
LLPLALEHLRASADLGLTLPLAVSLSAGTLATDFFAERLRDACAQAGARADRLQLELHDDSAGPDPDLLRQRLHELSAVGVRIVISDINRWRLPLSHMLGLPLAGLKCSARWAREQITEPRARAALGALVRVGHALGGHIVASGADTAADLVWLKEQQFDHAQGTACGSLMSAPEFLGYARTLRAKGPRIDPFSI